MYTYASLFSSLLELFPRQHSLCSDTRALIFVSSNCRSHSAVNNILLCTYSTSTHSTCEVCTSHIACVYDIMIYISYYYIYAANRSFARTARSGSDTTSPVRNANGILMSTTSVRRVTVVIKLIIYTTFGVRKFFLVRIMFMSFLPRDTQNGFDRFRQK